MTDNDTPSQGGAELNALGVGKDFVADVAHEMRNPLSALRAYTDLLRSERHGPHIHPQYKHYATVAHEAAEALCRICDRLLQEESGAVAEETVSTNGVQVAERAARRYGALAAEKNITLDVRFSDDFPKLRVPEEVLEDVLGNLITNAIKFTPVGGTVAVVGKLDPVTGAVIMVIRDTGTGMSPDKLSEVLRFLPVKPVEGLNGELGSGRGLSIVKKQLEPYGVEIEIRSNPNFGTSVSLIFPPG